MKKIIFLMLLVLVIYTGKLLANPIVVYWINEFSIDSSGWKMELHCDHPWQDSLMLDGWFLTSKTDTAYFKNGIYFNPADYLAVTDDDLQSRLQIDPNGDDIYLFRLQDGYVVFLDYISFGRDISIYPISTPKQGQSICRELNAEFFYIDNTPTFGYENDYSDITGYVEGYVKDVSGNPIEGVIVNSNSMTDSKGYFKLMDYARVLDVYFNKDNYINKNIILQIWPDSTVTIADVNLVAGVVEKIPSNVINNYNLTQNFPNPFNNSTSFFYTLPKGNNVDIKIYDEKGALAQKIFSGYQSAGRYKVNWNADNLASGVYIYQVRSGSFNLSKKAILLK